MSADGKRRSDGLFAFFALACGITWVLDLPLALAWWRRVEPEPYALGLAALSALGPTIAAVLVAAPRKELRQVFGRWRASPIWILVALATPMALHLPATAIEVLLGGRPEQWIYLPNAPERVAALVLFSVGEEFGWRGFGYPRVAERYGPVAGSLVLGLVWAVWHALMMISPEDGTFQSLQFGSGLIELPLYSLIFAWLLERSNRSILVAIALHAGGHLDNVNLAPDSEIRLRVLRLLILAIAAILAARALGPRKRPGEGREPG